MAPQTAFYQITNCKKVVMSLLYRLLAIVITISSPPVKCCFAAVATPLFHGASPAAPLFSIRLREYTSADRQNSYEADRKDAANCDRLISLLVFSQ